MRPPCSTGGSLVLADGSTWPTGAPGSRHRAPAATVDQRLSGQRTATAHPTLGPGELCSWAMRTRVMPGTGTASVHAHRRLPRRTMSRAMSAVNFANAPAWTLQQPGLPDIGTLAFSGLNGHGQLRPAHQRGGWLRRQLQQRGSAQAASPSHHSVQQRSAGNFMPACMPHALAVLDLPAHRWRQHRGRHSSFRAPALRQAGRCRRRCANAAPFAGPTPDRPAGRPRLRSRREKRMRWPLR